MARRPGATIGRRAALALAGAAALWLAADLAHSRLVAWRLGRWETAHARDADGVQVGEAAYTFGEGDVALLLVHGLGDSPRGWDRIAPRLAEAGFTCRVMRLPGFAEPIDAQARVAKEDWIGAVAFEAAELRRDHDRVAIVAHSLGGSVAIATVLEGRAEIDALVLLAPLIEVSDRRSPLLSARTWHRIVRRITPFTRVTESPFPIDARDPTERDDPERFRFTHVAVFDELFELLDGIRARAGELTVPLMTVTSPHDRVTDPAATARFHEAAGSAVKVRAEAVEGGHAMLRDHGWERLASEIGRFARR